jgi:hypothetical protein
MTDEDATAILDCAEREALRRGLPVSLAIIGDDGTPVHLRARHAEATAPDPEARSTDLTTAESEALFAAVDQHVRAEVAQDIDGILASLCDQPRYEIHPLGYVLTTRDAVRAFYTRMVTMFGDVRAIGPSATWDAGNSGKYLGRDAIATRDYGVLIDDAGREISIKCMALFVADRASGLLKGEHIFLNAGAASIFRKRLGEDFTALPGVAVE